MIDARLLRGWLRTTNVVLGLGVLGVAGRLWLWPPDASARPAEPLVVVLPSDPAPANPATDALVLDEIVGLVHRFHGVPRADDATKVPAVAAETEHGPLPLTLFRIATVIREPGHATIVQVVSKDPAREESHGLVEGESVAGILLEAVVFSEESATARVSRGTERTELVLRWGDASGDRIIRPVARVASSPPASTVRAGGAPTGRAPGPPGVRTVPFRGASGDVIGLRVTGIDPQGPWAASGVRVGEAILALDGVAVTDPTRVAREWRDGRGAREVLVRDALDERAAPRTVRLP